MNFRLAILLPVVLLPACMTQPVLTSTLSAPAATPAQTAQIGVRVPALSPAETQAAVARQKAQLERRLEGAAAPVRVSLLPGDALELRLASGASFESGSAQLKPAALLSYAGIAEVLLEFPGSVAHVRVYGEGVASGEPVLGLSARRAASVLDYLARRGVPATRLRAEGREGAGAPDEVQLVLKPVVQGREAFAWMPPD